MNYSIIGNFISDENGNWHNKNHITGISVTKAGIYSEETDKPWCIELQRIDGKEGRLGLFSETKEAKKELKRIIQRLAGEPV